jgi:hypothetical protein
MGSGFPFDAVFCHAFASVVEPPLNGGKASKR